MDSMPAKAARASNKIAFKRSCIMSGHMPAGTKEVSPTTLEVSIKKSAMNFAAVSMGAPSFLQALSRKNTHLDAKFCDM